MDSVKPLLGALLTTGCLRALGAGALVSEWFDHPGCGRVSG